MGIFLNPGAAMLRQARNSKVYVDKSGMLRYLNSVLNSEQKYVCVSRPRRFGKTMAANMVCAYYDRTVDGAAEFAGDPGFDVHRNSFDVLHLNMQQFLSATHDAGKLVDMLYRVVSRELARAYPGLDIATDMGLPMAMADCYAQTGRQFVVVIDEWDCLMREKRGHPDEQKTYLDFLRAWLKDQPAVALCYMTGILPIKKYGSHSALNMFNEFSMLGAEELAPYVGFTEDEVAGLCARFDANLTDCRAWYDGYRVAGVRGGEVETFCPRSVETGNFRSYWNETETFEALKRFIDLDLDGLHEKVVRLVAGGRVSVNTETYVNDMTTLNTSDDVLTLLVHLGYLTYDAASREVYVPNREVMGAFTSSMSLGGGWGEVSRSIAESERLLDALVAGDAGAVVAGVERAHEDASSVVIELKYGAIAGEALAQIRERGYDRALDGLVASGDVVLCGIAYDPRAKAHSCVIERA